jgi:hypothetical protein
MMTQPVLGACREKQRLTDEIRVIMDEIVKLEAEQLEAVLDGKSSLAEVLERHLVNARHRKNNALAAYKQHVGIHRC